ncbi:hypothetical protein ADIARSV_3686 [Arcticibacter svalbardensis MN12-7]|uniref:Uncharacterized protein n=1 Tax=Arcticibacter svalbardensis MN12-7 TaxID=1150600 RepID=R9GN47_9SPHI|nr:hypothetical protein ADIARSV_3686 [Arcticibacter svalbardensis MN12-7]
MDKHVRPIQKIIRKGLFEKFYKQKRLKKKDYIQFFSLLIWIKIQNPYT